MKDEKARLSGLSKLDVLDTPAEERFDRLTRLARRHFNVPFSMITMIDENRQWFKSAQGHLIPEGPRPDSFCHTTILTDQPLVVQDATQDQRFQQLPAVEGEMGLRFYAGVPLTDTRGNRVGTLCVLDTKPRDLTLEEVADLKDLAALASNELHLIRFTRVERELLKEMDQLRRQSSIDPVTRAWNSEAFHQILTRECATYKMAKEKLTVLLLEMTSLQQINVEQGLHFGNLCLRMIADRLRAMVHKGETFGRYQGGRFIYLTRVRPQHVEEYAQSFMVNLQSQPFNVMGTDVEIPATAGVALWRGTQEDVSDWLKRAQKALRSATPRQPFGVAL